MLSERVGTVIEHQTLASDHLAALHKHIEGLSASNAEVIQRQDATEERLNAALRQLQETASGRTPAPPAPEESQTDQATKKSRVNEQGLSRDASPSASASQTPRATTASSAKGAPSVAFSPVGHQPRSSARRSTSVPSHKQGSVKYEVVLLRFKTPHSSGFSQKWLGSLFARLPEDVPLHEVRILSFHDYITLIFDHANDADACGRILRQARPRIVLSGDKGIEQVQVIRDRPPEVRRRGLGLQHVWKAIEATASGKRMKTRTLHRTRGARKYTQLYLVDESADESQMIAKVGRTDDSQSFRVTTIVAEDDIPDDVREALAQLPLCPGDAASAPPPGSADDAEMAPPGPSA